MSDYQTLLNQKEKRKFFGVCGHDNQEHFGPKYQILVNLAL
jgi:hypothetical protein